jgi:hypothetical protein
MGVVMRRKGREIKERREWERFWRRQTDLRRHRGIFADRKTGRREDFSVVPGGGGR